MSPCFTPENVGHVSSGYAAFNGKISLREFASRILLSCPHHNLFRELGNYLIFSSNDISSPLIVHVLKVLSLRAGIKVTRIAASLTVNARMANAQPNRSIAAVVNHPCDNVRTQGELLSAKSDTDFTVARTSTGCPSPTFMFFSFCNFTPKPFLESFREYLREQFRADRFVLHSDSLNRLLCHAFDCRQAVRGHFYFTP